MVKDSYHSYYATITHDLRLLTKDSPWEWTEKQEILIIYPVTFHTMAIKAEWQAARLVTETTDIQISVIAQTRQKQSC